MIFIEIAWIWAATLVTFMAGQVLAYVMIKEDRKGR